MKQLILFLVLLAGLSSYGQSDTIKMQPNNYWFGNYWERVYGKKQILPPQDTVFTKWGIAQIGSKFYVGNGSLWTEKGFIPTLQQVTDSGDSSGNRIKLVRTDTTFIDFNAPVKRVYDGGMPSGLNDTVYTTTPTSWYGDPLKLPVFRMRHPLSSSGSTYPQENVNRDFQILPYSSGWAIESNHTLEFWVPQMSVHRGLAYKDLEGKGNGWGGIFWVGDDNDAGGLRMTARDNTATGGNIVYSEISSEKFTPDTPSTPSGALRFRLPLPQHNFQFVYGNRGDSNFTATIDTTGLSLYRNVNGFKARFSPTSITADRVLTLPDASGTIALSESTVSTLAAIGSSPNANGATISGSTLNLQPASASFGGVVTTGTQTFAGAKTFNSTITLGTTGTTGEVRWVRSSDGLVTTTAKNLNASGTIFSLQNIAGNLQFQGAWNISTSGHITPTDVNVFDVGSSSLPARNMYSGNFIGKLTPPAGTATAGTAPLKFTSGTNLTTPENGAVEYDGTNYFVTSGGVRYTLNRTLTGSHTFDAPSIAAGGSTSTSLTVTGAAVGDIVTIGLPDDTNTGVENIIVQGRVSSANTVTFILFNFSGSAVDLASFTYKVSVQKL